MDLQELIEEFRRQVNDEAQPYLWSDDEALAYAIDAQDQFVRLTGGRADVTVATPSTTQLTDLALVASSPYSAISPYILRIRSGRLLTAKIDVTFGRETDMGHVMVQDYGWSRGMSFDDADVGNVRYGILGVRDDFVRWVRVPVADDTCRLHVFRLPFPRISTQDDALEIDPRHHARLVDWMKYLCYKKQDAEARDDARSKQGEADFVAYCTQAKNELSRARYRPGQVQYGGI